MYEELKTKVEELVKSFDLKPWRIAEELASRGSKGKREDCYLCPFATEVDKLLPQELICAVTGEFIDVATVAGMAADEPPLFQIELPDYLGHFITYFDGGKYPFLEDDSYSLPVSRDPRVLYDPATTITEALSKVSTA